jgi:VanZ family protein
MHSDIPTESNSLRRLAVVARWATVTVFLAMFIGTHLPAQVTNEIVYHDKLIHFWAYLTLSFLAVSSWDLSIGGLRPIHFLVIWMAGAVYGAIDELTQIPVGRSCDAWDWMFDVAGVLAGLTLFRILRPLIYRLALLVAVPARASR